MSADEILTSKHAGEARKLSKKITAEDMAKWETENIQVMKYLLSLKAEQCTRF